MKWSARLYFAANELGAPFAWPLTPFAAMFAVLTSRNRGVFEVTRGCGVYQSLTERSRRKVEREFLWSWRRRRDRLTLLKRSKASAGAGDSRKNLGGSRINLDGW